MIAAAQRLPLGPLVQGGAVFPDGLSGAAGWLLMTAFWLSVVTIAVWALRRILPDTDRREPPAGSGESTADVDQIRRGTAR